MSLQPFRELSEGSHLGHLIFDYMRRNPDNICQIDAATGQEETNSSVLSRSIRLAQAFRKFRLQPGDVVAFGGYNHLDLYIPYYAALMNGHPIVGVDPLFKQDEIKSLFKITQPAIAFCQRNALDDYERAARELALNLKIVTFDDGEESMERFLEKYKDEEPETKFKVADFDQEKVYVFLISTSGTSGILKVAAFKHAVVVEKFLSFIEFVSGPLTANKIALNLTPVQWISGFTNAIAMPIMNQTKVQTSKPLDAKHLIDIVNKYKPHTIVTIPSLILMLLAQKHEVDLSCFKSITLTGNKINSDLLYELKAHLRKSTLVMEAYGMTETLGPALSPNVTGPKGSCGRPAPNSIVKLVDPDTGMEINEPYVPGELLVKCLCFTEYYRNPEETQKVFTKDGLMKTGDLMYRDEDYNLYFVERIKMLIKNRNIHVIPTELEDLILQHPGVTNVCVTGIPHPEDGQHPAAFVVRRPGSTVTAQDIKDLVASKLSKYKELKGGVAFVDELPMTSTGKIARGKLTELVLTAIRE